MSKRAKALKVDARPDDDIEALIKKLKQEGVITEYQEKKTGRVKFYNHDKNWGFIIADGVSYFLHVKHLRFDTPMKGEPVTFAPSTRGGKPIALHVQRLTGN